MDSIQLAMNIREGPVFILGTLNSLITYSQTARRVFNENSDYSLMKWTDFS